MVKKSLVLNYIFNLIKTLCNTVFPVVTFTYSAHILGASGIGQANFAKSIASYFVMLAMLGMNYYGTREAAKLRDEKDKFSKFSHEMLFINMGTTILAYGLFFVILNAIPQFENYKVLLIINSLAIPLQGLGMEWLYQALEEYQYITIRSVIFQIIALIIMFIFVRDASDVPLYVIITLFASSGSYILNFINSRKYITFHWYGNYKIKKHLKPLLWLFAMTVSIELYTILDSTMLGFLKGDTAVGKYTIAVKVNRLVNSLITAVGVVLVPRLSYYFGNNQQTELKMLVRKAYNYIFLLSVPAAVGLFMLCDDIILLFGGRDFKSANLTMRILVPIVLVIPFSIVTNLQTFIPMGKEKLILLSTMVGAIINFTLNMILIPRYAENGAAIATVLAETAVAVVCFINAKKYFDMKQIFNGYYQYWIAAIPIPVVLNILKELPIHYIIRMVIVILISACTYFVILVKLDNIYMKEALDKIYEKKCKR